MTEVITYSYARKLLQKTNITFIEFQLVLRYLYTKLWAIKNLKLKKEVKVYWKQLLYDLVIQLENKILANGVKDFKYKEVLLDILEEYKNLLNSVQMEL